MLFQRLIDAQEGRGEGEMTVVETLRGKAPFFFVVCIMRGGFMSSFREFRVFCVFLCFVFCVFFVCFFMLCFVFFFVCFFVFFSNVF